MSRIGKKPIVIPDGVTAVLDSQTLTVKGPKGELSFEVPEIVTVVMTEKQIDCSISKSSKQATSMWGTVRARIDNMVIGVSEGFKKELELHGVGYRASVSGNKLEVLVGYSHPVIFEAPEGISFSVEKETITVEGIDKVLVGQQAADIRATRKPEPYKGKGIRYVGEQVRRKVGKVVGAAA